MVNIDEFSGNATKLYNSIEKVRIVRGILDTDPITWELSVLGQTLKIPIEKLETQSMFRCQYLRAFNRPAPKVKGEEWDRIVEALASDESKVEIETEIEESDNVYIARQMIEEIKKISVDDDEAYAYTGKCLIKRDGLYYLTSNKIEDMINTNGYKIAANKLSPAMYQLGFKTKGTERIYLSNKRARVWAFYENVIELSE